MFLSLSFQVSDLMSKPVAQVDLQNNQTLTTALNNLRHFEMVSVIE